MTIRKKLLISNILMIVIPVVAALLVGGFCLFLPGSQSLDSLEDLFEYDNGMYSAQSLIFSYRGEITADSHSKIRSLGTELENLNFHFSLWSGDEIVYTNLTMEEERRIAELERGIQVEQDSLMVTSQDTVLIQQQLSEEAGKPLILTAVRLTGDGVTGGYMISSLRNYLITVVLILSITILGTIVVTNFLLTHWVSRSILRPMRHLQECAHRIEEGDLDFELPAPAENEIGEVCRDFDSMRGRLKEAANTRLEYESYRKELLAGISHDLRTPLTSIKGYVEGLIEGIANTEEKKQRYYRAIETRTKDMEALVENLSSFTRLEAKPMAFHPEELVLADFVAQVLKEYEEEARKQNILFVNEVRDRQLKIGIDYPEMKRALVNLFENSVKYRTKENSVIRIRAERIGRFIHLNISDDGPGVPEEELEHIFVSFYRGDQARTNPGSGSGLGLAIVKQIAEGHGGTVYARNQQGLTVVIKLPVNREKRHA